MLNDARNLWQSFSAAAATINDNISTALERLDQEVDENDAERNEESELEIYKKLLDEAQMEQVTLSKAMRTVIAEKEAELDLWKKKVEGDSTSVSDSVGVEIRREQLQIENRALKENLEAVEEQLKEVISERNEIRVKALKLEDMQIKYQSMKADLLQLSIEMDRRDKQKNETIENLVSEYSTLAAETELKQNRDTSQLSDVMRENEVLVTRVRALEHSISDLADRATQHHSMHDNHGAGDDATQQTPERKIHQQQLQELKEVRAKLVNIQFDLKERDTQIEKLNEQLRSQQNLINSLENSGSGGGGGSSALLPTPPSPHNSRTASSSTASFQGGVSDSSTTASSPASLEIITTLEKSLQKLKEESENLRSDVVRLQVEKREAEDAGKSFFEKNKGMVKEVEDLKKAQQQQQINSTVSVPDINPLTGEIESLRAKVAEEVERRQKLEADLAVALEQSKSLASSAQEGETALQLELEKVRTALEAKEKELQSFHAQSPVLEEKVKRIAELEIELSTANDEAKASKSDVAKLTAELEVAAKSVAASEAELTAKIAEIAALTGAKASTEEQVSLLTTKLADFEALLAKTKEELEATKLAADGNVSHIKEQFACDQQTALDEAKKAFEAELQAAIAAARHEDVTKAEADMKEVTLKYDAQVADLEVKVSQLEIEVSAAAAALEAAKIKHTEELTAAVASERQRVEGAAQEELQYRLSSAESTAAVNMKAALQALGEDLRAASAASELALQERLTAEKLEAIASEKATAEAALAAALSELSNRLNSEKISALEDARRVSEELVEKVKAEAATVLANTTRQFEDKVAEVEAARQKAIAELHSAEERYERKMHDSLAALEAKKDVERAAALHHLKAEMQLLVDRAVHDKDEYLAMYTKESKLRKAIHNKLLDLQGNIRVICRVRPILEVERRSGEDVDVTEFPSDEDIVIAKDPQQKMRYEFDRVFAPGSPQGQVFEAVQPLCVSVLDGYNICIFAYGQTGSGKTYTMEGDHSDYEHSGVSPRAVGELFRIVENLTPTWTYTLTFSMLEIYNETILDLLDGSGMKDKLDVRQTPEGNVVPVLTEIIVTSPSQVLELMGRGQANRAVGSHDMNEHSSRSHSILTIVCRGRNSLDGTTTFGKLNLIDLAGSERVGKTDATGDRLKEAQNINRSLSALGDVIAALGNKKATHVPYRNSKLTFLLQDSLGGNSKVMMFVNISPAIYNVGETVCSLTFAHRCRSVELGQAKKQVGSSASDDGGGSSGASGSSQKAPLRRAGPAGSSGSLGSSSFGSASASDLPLVTPNKRLTSERASPLGMGRK